MLHYYQSPALAVIGLKVGLGLMMQILCYFNALFRNRNRKL